MQHKSQTHDAHDNDAHDNDGHHHAAHPSSRHATMDNTQVYYRHTTAQQRRLLFAVWEETGDVGEACRQARVSVRTFYYWKPRFEAGGYGALRQTRSHAPKTTRRIAPQVEAQIVALHQAQPTWGKSRIAKAVVQLDNSLTSLSPNTVRRVLEDAGLWPSVHALA